MNHILRAQQFDKSSLERLFKKAAEIQGRFETPTTRPQLRELLCGKLAVILFYEASTRTSSSFAAAAHHVGMGSILIQNAREFSSAIKGETLEDTIQTYCQYGPDVIILRHYEMGAADRAAAIVERKAYPTTIINAGDGKGQHPTQALLDLFTIQSRRGRLNDLTVTVGGDLANGRTARSLVYLLSKFPGVKFNFISPSNLVMEDDIKGHLREHGIEFVECTSLQEALSSADVVYWTRIQTERGGVNDEIDLTIGVEQMKWLPEKAVLLHPLPRVGEISRGVDEDPRAAYFNQVRNGMFIRMALLQEACLT